MYQSTILIKDDVESLERLLIPEQKNLGRSSFDVLASKDQLLLNVRADDATAFKTVMNTLAKIFAAWEGTKRIAKGQ
jgi:tRNA threonylcarbamoyladenosine modification (KEOPS) complex  Pcc1 subunit